MNPGFIIDCSITMAWCFEDEATPKTEELHHRLATEAAIVPAHWFLEVANVLALAEQRKRISTKEVAEFLARLETHDIQADEPGEARVFNSLLPLCRTYRLTSYDAAYLDLAMRRRIPLATLDEDLRAAAKAAGVELLGA